MANSSRRRRSILATHERTPSEHPRVKAPPRQRAFGGTQPCLLFDTHIIKSTAWRDHAFNGSPSRNVTHSYFKISLILPRSAAQLRLFCIQQPRLSTPHASIPLLVAPRLLKSRPNLWFRACCHVRAVLGCIVLGSALFVHVKRTRANPCCCSIAQPCCTLRTSWKCTRHTASLMKKR